MTKSSMVDEILNLERRNDMRSQLIEVNYELTANNYETFDEFLDKRHLGREVVQNDSMRGIRRSFRMYRDSHLFQSVDHYRQEQKKHYRVSLACIDPRAENSQVLEWKWVSTAIATAIWTVVLMYVGYFTSVPAELGWVQPDLVIAAAVLMATITAIALLLFVYYRKDWTVFRTNQAGVPLIRLETNKPDEATFAQLRKSISAGISSSLQHKDTEEVLICELKELRRLRDEGIIEDDVYEDSREKIFDHYSCGEAARQADAEAAC